MSTTASAHPRVSVTSESEAVVLWLRGDAGALKVVVASERVQCVAMWKFGGGYSPF